MSTWGRDLPPRSTSARRPLNLSPPSSGHLSVASELLDLLRPLGLPLRPLDTRSPVPSLTPRPRPSLH